MPIPHPTDLLSLPNHSRPTEAGWTRHIDSLTTYLHTLQHALTTQNPDDLPDNATSYATPEQRHTIFLTGHLLLLGLHTINHGQDLQRRTVTLTQDLATTLNHFHPIGQVFQDYLNHLAVALLSGQVNGSPYHHDELHHAAAFLLDRTQELHLSLPSLFHESGLFWTLYHRPEHLQDPTHPDLLTLLPDPTQDPAHQPREQALEALLTPDLHPTEQAALVFLLHLNARDRYTDQSVIVPLNHAARCLLAARDIHAQARTSPQTTRLLQGHLQAIHQELDRIRVPALRVGTVLQHQERDLAYTQALGVLRRIHHRQLAELPGIDSEDDRLLWDIFDQIDQQLVEGLDPHRDQALRLRLMLSTCARLAQAARAPGMGLTPTLQMATTLTGIDPLWGWKEILLNPNPNTNLEHAINQFTVAIDLLPVTNALEPDAPERQQALSLVREFAGHLRACLRALNLRLPLHEEFEDSLHSLGTLRASPQTPQENEDALRLWLALRDHFRQQASLQEQPTPEAQGESTSTLAIEDSLAPVLAPTPKPETSHAPPSPETPPAAPLHLQHVQQARALLEGRALTLIGGVPDPAHHQALVDALGLTHLDWIGADEYDHGTHAHARITDQTAVVILAIRWMGHAHNALRDVARAKGIPYVMHPGGLNPSSIAWQILQQVSTQLTARAS